MKTNRLYINYLLPLILITSVLVSCKKTLDVQPESYVADDVTITDAASAQTAVRGLYNGLITYNYYGNTYQEIGYMSGDNLAFFGTVISQNQFIQHNVRADNGDLSSAWGAIYAVINRANHVIAKVPGVSDPKLTPVLKNQLLGEAYFVRALAYFDLVRVWGGVQIVLTPTVTISDKAGITRSTVEQTYAQVLSDLVAAETLLPNTLNRNRATQKTVWALRARYHLYRGEWAQAVTYATNVISDAASFSLVAPYSSFFANSVVNTKESVLELSYNAAYVTATNSHRNNWQPTQNGGNRSWGPNAALISLLSTPATGGNRNTLIATTTTAPIVTYGNLYYRKDGTDPAYVIRIAELFLIRAEAYANQGNLAGALTDLNAVRTRAALAASTAVTQDDVLLAIENERRLEFAFEPHRWFDLVRTNRAGTVLGVTNPNKYVLPIPITELQTDGSLTQNPGY